MTPEQLAALVADRETGTPGPWAWYENHPLNACANVTAEDGAGWTIDIATLYGNSDVVQAPTAPDEPWGDHPIRRADARRIARVPDLEDVVIALVAERDALQAEVARLSTPPDDAEVAGVVADEVQPTRTFIKDRNGREIMLGDRVLHHNASPHTKPEYWNGEYEVRWEAPSFVLRHVGGGLASDVAFYFRHYPSDLEVIPHPAGRNEP